MDAKSVETEHSLRFYLLIVALLIVGHVFPPDDVKLPERLELSPAHTVVFQTDLPQTFRRLASLMSNMSNRTRASTGDIADVLATLRDDVARLTQWIATVVAVRGGGTWRKTKSNTEGVISEAQGVGAWDRISLWRDLAAVTAA